MFYKEENKTFYIFFSAFYRDTLFDQVRSHIVLVKTHDWKTFSDPILNFSGKEEGFTGMCSPSIQLIDGLYYLVFNSWGFDHPNGGHNWLFCMTSEDLEVWSERKQVGDNLTHELEMIDIEIAKANGKFYIIFKDQTRDANGKKNRFPRMAWAKDLFGEWFYIGDGLPDFTFREGVNRRPHLENYQFIKIDGDWRIIIANYPPQIPMFFTMIGDGKKDEDWLHWEDGYPFNVEEEDFNSGGKKAHRSNAAFLTDWRQYDGYFYLLYAGRTHGRSHAGRGNNKLALSRSKDLKNWTPAGRN